MWRRSGTGGELEMECWLADEKFQPEGAVHVSRRMGKEKKREEENIFFFFFTLIKNIFKDDNYALYV